MTDNLMEEAVESERQGFSTDFSEAPVTISDVITKLNSTILANTVGTASINDQKNRELKGFELHTRLPDGSARPATTAEVATADFKSKLQRAIATLQSLPDDVAKLNWAENQRVNVGNVYFGKHDYESAIDVYLICLTVATPPPSPHSEAKYTMEHLILYMKLMNNLALCTLQLSWYRKTITFCTIAIDQILVAMSNEEISQLKYTSGDVAIIILEQRIKLHYKRAKAHRLKGEYDSARLDINLIKNELNSYSSEITMKRNTDSNIIKSIESMHITFYKEEQLLQRAIHQGNMNFKQYQVAMKQLLKQNNDSISAKAVKGGIERPHSNNRKKIIQPLYYDHHNVNPTTYRKNFSNLRARKSYSDDKNGDVPLSERAVTSTESNRILKIQTYIAPMYSATVHFVGWVCKLFCFLLSFGFRSRKEKKI